MNDEWRSCRVLHRTGFDIFSFAAFTFDRAGYAIQIWAINPAWRYPIIKTRNTNPPRMIVGNDLFNSVDFGLVTNIDWMITETLCNLYKFVR